MCNAPWRRYLVAMLSRLPDHAIRCLRLLALAALVLGLLAKPILVAACELEDLRLAQVETGSVVDDAGEPGGDPCCPGQACGPCCAVTTLLPAAVAAGQVATPVAHPQPALRAGHAPAPLPVAYRPPIRA